MLWLFSVHPTVLRLNAQPISYEAFLPLIHSLGTSFLWLKVYLCSHQWYKGFFSHLNLSKNCVSCLWSNLWRYIVALVYSYLGIRNNKHTFMFIVSLKRFLFLSLAYFVIVIFTSLIAELWLCIYIHSENIIIFLKIAFFLRAITFFSFHCFCFNAYFGGFPLITRDHRLLHKSRMI